MQGVVPIVEEALAVMGGTDLAHHEKDIGAWVKAKAREIGEWATETHPSRGRAKRRGRMKTAKLWETPRYVRHIRRKAARKRARRYTKNRARTAKNLKYTYAWGPRNYWKKLRKSYRRPRRTFRRQYRRKYRKYY